MGCIFPTYRLLICFKMIKMKMGSILPWLMKIWQKHWSQILPARFFLLLRCRPIFDNFRKTNHMWCPSVTTVLTKGLNTARQILGHGYGFQMGVNRPVRLQVRHCLLLQLRLHPLSRLLRSQRSNGYTADCSVPRSNSQTRKSDGNSGEWRVDRKAWLGRRLTCGEGTRPTAGG